MKVLIQNCDTLFFLARDGSWSPDVEQAERFPNSVDALNASTERKLRNVQIVLKFPESFMDVRLPVQGSGCDSAPNQQTGS